MKRSKTEWNEKRGVWEPKISEEQVLKEIVVRLWLQAKIRAYRIRERIPGRGVLSTPGLPDLMGWTSTGVAVLIEVKRPGGARRPAQIQFITDARLGGCVAFFAESWADCVIELRTAGVEVKDEYTSQNAKGETR